MSALRQYEYDLYLDAPEVGALQRKSKAPTKKVSKRKQYLLMAVERLAVFLVIIALVAGVVSGCTFILKRYVEIHRTQGEIFTLKQEVKSLDKKRDELLIQKESEMTLQELEDYATNYLDMIKASEGYKVVVSKGYNVVENDLIKPGTSEVTTLDEPTDDPLIALGAWLKRIASF